MRQSEKIADMTFDIRLKRQAVVMSKSELMDGNAFDKIAENSQNALQDD